MGTEVSRPQDAKPDTNAEQPIGFANLTGLSLPDIFEQFADGIAYCRMIYENGQPIDFEFLYTNPAFHKFTGLGRVVDKRVSEVIPGTQRSDPWLIETCGRVATTGQPQAFENFLVGLKQWFSIRATCPQPGHFIAVFTKVAARKDYEAGLAGSEACSRALFDASPVPSAVNDRFGNILYLNAAFCRTFGYTLEELHSLDDWWPRAYPDPAYREWVSQTWQARLDQSLEDGKPFETMEVRIQCQSGEIRTVMASAVPFAGFDEETLHLVTLYDITPRIEAERALAKSEERLSLAQSAARIGTWDWNLESSETFFNDQYYELLGLPHGVPHTYEDFLEQIHPDDRTRVESAFQSALAGGSAYELEFRIVKANDNSVRWIHDQGEVQFDENGKPFRAMGVTYDITNRIQDLEKIREREQLLSSFLNHSSTVAWLKDGQGRYVFISPNHKKRFGLQERDWKGKTDFEIWPDNLAEDYRKNDLKVIESGSSLEMIESARNPDGVISWWRSSKFSFSDPAGNRYVGGLAIDITQIKEAERHLAESEERFRSLFEGSRDGIAIVDMIGRIQHANPAFQAMLGYSLDELKQLTYLQLTPVCWHEAEATVLRDRVLPHGDSQEYEKEYIRKDGQVFPISLRTSLLCDANGRPQGMWAIVRDITERKRTERALRESEARYRLLVEQTPDGIVVTDSSGRYTDVNQAGAEMFGYTREEFLRLSVSDMVLPDDIPPLQEEMSDLASGTITRKEWRFRRKDGSEFFGEVLARQMPAGAVQGVVRDITARKQAEQVLRDADRRKNEFLAMLAHELRNPLAPMRIGLGILRRSSENPETVARTLDLLDRQMLVMIRLINELLDLSRITSGKIELQTSDIELIVLKKACR
ncbi:PAS domain S-box protein [Methyloterricola oryzae]|uniref:PAS domain S-box protein n=1 Tax=Methyloterricola oryzae TaxID=1495050 RepID=UPI0005EBEF43|nr:PAS domain S-box protein [Methyloterricola oryzae]